MAEATIDAQPPSQPQPQPHQRRRRRRSLKRRIQRRLWRTLDKTANIALWTCLALPPLWLLYALKSMFGVDVFPGSAGLHIDPYNIARQLGYLFR